MFPQLLKFKFEFVFSFIENGAKYFSHFTQYNSSFSWSISKISLFDSFNVDILFLALVLLPRSETDIFIITVWFEMKFKQFYIQ